MKKKIGIALFTLLLSILLSLSASAEKATELTDTIYPETLVVDNVLYERGVEHFWILEEGTTYEHYETLGNFYVVKDYFYDEEAAKSATELVIPSTINGLPVTEIYIDNTDGSDEGFGAFNEIIYENITSIKLPSTLKKISYYSFSQFPNVEYIELPESVELIDVGAFGAMTSLKEITIPSKVTKLPKYCFYNCVSLEKINFEGTIDSISTSCFENCKSLKTIDLPEAMSGLGSRMFKNSGITNITIPVLSGKYTNYASVFYGCENLETAVFLSDENSEISLGSSYFANCTKLKNVTFSGTYKEVTIAKTSFKNCTDLRNLYFESLKGTINVTKKNAFKTCYMLSNIYYAASEKKWKTFVKEDSVEEKAFKNFTINYLYNHTHAFSFEGEIPTCTKGATHKYTCDCGFKYTYKVGKDTSNHSYGSWKTVKKATLEKTGTKQKTCTRCGKVKSKKIDKLIDISTYKIKVHNAIYSKGEPVKTGVTVTSKKSPYKDLKKGVHFKVTYENNVNVGTEAVAIIKGINKNGYGGTKKVKFSIAPSDPENFRAVKKSITSTSIKVKWDKSPGATDYKINIREINDSYDKATIIPTTKTSLTIKELKPNTTYSISITAYATINDKRLYDKMGGTADTIIVTTKK